jgi:hypothetical protein
VAGGAERRWESSSLRMLLDGSIPLGVGCNRTGPLPVILSDLSWAACAPIETRGCACTSGEISHCCPIFWGSVLSLLKGK